MKKIVFTRDIVPHVVAILIFLIVTAFFFKPAFFDNKTLAQHDIQMFQGSAKSIQDFREQYGEEPLWTNSMFGGMPAYLVSVVWSNGPVSILKSVLSLGISHPIANIFLAFISFYIMLLCFRIRPYLAIAGAVAFGLSSYMIIGLSAGHNARIGAIALMPLVVGGIHLVFNRNKLLGCALTAVGLSLHLKENHLQITYYLLLIVLLYGLVLLVTAIREKTTREFFVGVAILVPTVLLAAGTFFGQFWAITEYSNYSTRGKSELVAAGSGEQEDSQGLSKIYAFEFSNGILEPFTLLIPNFYGGASSNYLVMDRSTKTFQALSRSSDQQTANQLARFSSAYWGPQRLAAPYYAGAVIVFLFAVGIAFAPRKYTWWLVSVSTLGIILSWGSNFASFNYFMFDYFPAYNKFRSVTFTLIMILFAMPLLGLLGVERLMAGESKDVRKKLWICVASTGGLCVIFMLFPSMLGLMKNDESELPPWFLNALVEDRAALLRSDALRSLGFIVVVFLLLYFETYRKLSPTIFYVVIAILVVIDLAVTDKRYFTEDNYKRKRDNSYFAMTEADREILNDKSTFRVFPINPQNPFGVFSDAKPSYYFQSIGGYHGAKLRRYQDFIDSCLFKQTQEFFTLAQQGNFNFSALGAFNMLNIKYFPYGPAKENVIRNTYANGNAWFVSNVVSVGSPAEELQKTCDVNTSTTAVIDNTKFPGITASPDSSAIIRLTESRLNYLKYESTSSVDGLAVFSEIYYPHGWNAMIDGKQVDVLRANYILRALKVPAGKHTIEFTFRPRAYTVGNKVTMASSWLVLLLLLFGLGRSVLKDKATRE